MPEISRFLGIIIRMYAKDHNPPHFHVTYNECEAVFSIEQLEILEGKLPPRVCGIVLEWALMHQKELMFNWEELRQEKTAKKIQPLV